MSDRSPDWFRQAERDLAPAREARASGRHEWACFAAHQAAEKAARSLHLRLGQEARGHSVAKLLRELPPSHAAPETLVQKAMVLDSHYVPTRYPNGHSEGAPFEHYGEMQSADGVSHAGEIVELVRPAMA